jgi:LmbE family N-acetylglucosaminyl deacetylase
MSHENIDAGGSVPGRAMVIFAHPDDAEFTCGGTVAKWARAGCAVCYVVTSDGSKGGDGLALADTALRDLREVEQRAAADLLGVAEVIFLRHPDGDLAIVPGLREQMAAAIRRWRPEVLLTWDAWRPYQLHPDHRAVGLAAVEAVLLAGNPRALPGLAAEGLGAHRVPAVYLFGTDHPEVRVDVRDTFGRKLEAVSLHRSQTGDLEETLEQVRMCNIGLGGSADDSPTEAFKVLRPFCEL